MDAHSTKGIQSHLHASALFNGTRKREQSSQGSKKCEGALPLSICVCVYNFVQLKRRKTQTKNKNRIKVSKYKHHKIHPTPTPITNIDTSTHPRIQKKRVNKNAQRAQTQNKRHWARVLLRCIVFLSLCLSVSLLNLPLPTHTLSISCLVCSLPCRFPRLHK